MCFTCSGVKEDAGGRLGLEGTGCCGGVEGLSVAMSKRGSSRQTAKVTLSLYPKGSSRLGGLNHRMVVQHTSQSIMS